MTFAVPRLALTSTAPSARPAWSQWGRNRSQGVVSAVVEEVPGSGEVRGEIVGRKERGVGSLTV